MLKISIVGKNYSELYLSIITKFENFNLTGLFDPSYQFESPKNIDPKYIFTSFDDLLNNSEAIVFASPEKIYLPLIEIALKYSKSVFLHSVHSLSLDEQLGLRKLHEEASEVLQIYQPVIFHDGFLEYRKFSQNPLLLQYNFSDKNESKLLVKSRSVAGALLSVNKSNVRKVTANTIAACAEVPDIIRVRIDFDNGGITEIMVNNLENYPANFLKCYEYNQYFEINFLKNEFSGTINDQQILINTNQENNTLQMILKKQLINFYFNIKNFQTPVNSIENEILTQKVIEKVKEKLRININIF